ncbi:hypothetical protein HDV57DRAFT_246991 [Trichoderma longibrachiatum]|uniref:Uncharacterized protein n=1 Tax=Trichoderma longibrachiatum ATCC 18648 TaxID=983965 RepID=A0A2T4C9W2_TRILO|nr:hypothetical protein M440DRAFT_1327825 [Trichoderma longibrachiatum ATCC 18648]
MAADDIEGDEKSHHTDEGVMHRKKELRGLPSSFSSNIGQRISPTRLPTPTSRTTTKDGRSVRSIVAWLESAATNADTSRDDLKSVHSVATISSAGSNSSLLSRHTIPGAEDVEEYSLTLLKYKKYYTEVPLGRCLDEQRRVDGAAADEVQGGNVNASTEVSRRPLQENDGFCGASVGGVCSDLHQQLSMDIGSGYAKTSALVDDKPSEVMPIAGTEDSCRNEEVQLFHRDPQEVMAF